MFLITLTFGVINNKYLYYNIYAILLWINGYIEIDYTHVAMFENHDNIYLQNTTIPYYYYRFE